MSNIERINTGFARFDDNFRTVVPNIVAETANEYFRDRFKQENWDGVPWKPLTPKYAAKKTRGRGRILVRDGILLNSIRPTTVTPNRVVITAGDSRTPYARIHNEGLRINGVQKVRGYTNSNFMGKGKPVKIRPHQRTVNFIMPKRQFIGRSPFLNAIIKERLTRAWNARTR